MSADVLRRAASLMRERAEASAPFVQAEGWWTQEGLLDVFADSSAAPIQGEREDAEHIASWHPAVALAVADWLDHDARLLEEMAKRPGGINAMPVARRDRSLAVARAYLGASS